jgi:nucleotide-binding universal stress UspA family protein
LEEIKALIKLFGAELHIIHVNGDSERIYTEETKEESGILQKQLDDLNPVYHFLSDTDIDRSLSEFAEKNQLDLLIAVPKEHNLIDKLVHKSHTKQLVLHTHIPVMSIHE